MSEETKRILLNEDQITERLKQWIEDSDADELARLAGEAFGGECFFGNGEYEFVPNENYYGAFDTVVKFVVRDGRDQDYPFDVFEVRAGKEDQINSYKNLVEVYEDFPNAVNETKTQGEC